MGRGNENANVFADCLGSRLMKTQCMHVTGETCLEGAWCTIGGSGSHGLLANSCNELIHANKMFKFELCELHAKFHACM